MTKKIYTNNKAFTLLEMTIVLAIICALTTVVGVRVVENVRILAAEKTAREMKVIQDAAKAYYVDNKAWPGTIDNLKTGGYLASAWTTNNPFGNAYNISTSGSSFQVYTNLQTNYHGVVTANLPSVTTSGDTVTSTIPIPGSESSSASIPSGVIAMWSGSIANIPAGWALCDGTNGTPDLRDRFIVGAGSGYAVASTGGEASHTLTIAEMPAHSHSIYGDGNGSFNGGGVFPAIGQSWHESDITSNTTGGGQAHENRPPYYGLAYIMKT